MWPKNAKEAKDILDLEQSKINDIFTGMVVECNGYRGCGIKAESAILTLWKGGAQCLDDILSKSSCYNSERLEDTKLMCPDINIVCEHPEL